VTRHYLMCRPTYFDVTYAINAWMDTSVPVDTDLAIAQWQALHDAYIELGHQVDVLEPVPGLPDMVFSANGAFSVGGTVYGAKFAHHERAAEARAHETWYREHGWTYVPAVATNEGEGDFTYVRGKELVLAGRGFRTTPEAHEEAAKVLDRQVLSLQLVDERFYHLDVALFVLDEENVCYFPGAFAPESAHALRRTFPDAVIATEADALAFGLNAVSDGTTVIIATEADALARRLDSAGYVIRPMALAELVKAGGNVKCCTAELRA